MKDAILEIMLTQEYWGRMNDINKSELAQKIAELMTAFIEWKDWQMNLKNIRHHFKRNKYLFEGEKITLNDLFTYWYTEIYKKQ